MATAFWESFEQIGELTLEQLGETIVLDGSEVTAVVDPGEIMQGAAAGGRKTDFAGEALVPAGTALSDGMAATVRGIDCAVDSWEPIGDGQVIAVRFGPKNRWSGELPGA